jgi:hypothetical protein
MKNPRCGVPQILQAAGPIVSIHLLIADVPPAISKGTFGD